ncbi:MAG: DUF3299 domain-containing protein [Gammaproteobacteria bacterium]
MNITFKFLITFIFAVNLVYANDARILEWDEMMPKGYVESLLDFNNSNNDFSASDSFSFDDDTEEAQSAYEELRNKLSSAPIVPELNDQFVKIAGFIVPLDFDFDSETFQQFLLVPYFGACIHTPPPPSNQIVHVTSKTALKQEWLDYAVWVSGSLSTQSKDSQQAYAGYSMNGVELEEYTEESE